MPLHRRGNRKSRKRNQRRKAATKRRRAQIPGKQRGGTNASIPKTVIQTSKDPIPEGVVKQLKKQLDGWDYKFFTDTDILQFFQENPLPDFPAITEKFNSFSAGPHKADLFRYYYIYINGGVFIDSDLMLYDSLDRVIGQNSFVSVWALRPADSVFNGFLAAAPRQTIIEAALKDLYAMTNEQLIADYTIVCKNLGGFVKKNMGAGVKMLKELTNNDTYCRIEDPDTGKASLIHYQSMPIPDEPVEQP